LLFKLILTIFYGAFWHVLNMYIILKSNKLFNYHSGLLLLNFFSFVHSCVFDERFVFVFLAIWPRPIILRFWEECRSLDRNVNVASFTHENIVKKISFVRSLIYRELYYNIQRDLRSVSYIIRPTFANVLQYSVSYSTKL
jgi:hypothetical protein